LHCDDAASIFASWHYFDVVTNDHPFATDLSRFDGRNSLTCLGAGVL
jgi:hypothetical protein